MKLLLHAGSILSLKSGKRIALVLYIIVSKLIRYRRNVILENLHRVYGPDLPMEKSKLLKAIYTNFVFLWMEYLQAGYNKKEVMLTSCRFHNRELIDRALEEGKGLIIMTGHMGNFEWFAYVLAMMGYTISGVAKKQSNPYVNKMVHKSREQFGTKVIYTRNAMKEGVEALKHNEILGLIADQDARDRGVFIDFLGTPASTPVGPAVFHLRSEAPVLFCAAIRRDYATFDVYFEPLLDAGGGDVTDDNIKKITTLHVRALEKWVRKYPEQWFWMHRRWKTKPE